MSLTETSSEKPTVVLVHGAFAESSSWSGVISGLLAERYPTIAVANPLRGVTFDSEYLRALLVDVEGDIVLVGHSTVAPSSAAAVPTTPTSKRSSSSAHSLPRRARHLAAWPVVCPARAWARPSPRWNSPMAVPTCTSSSRVTTPSSQPTLPPTSPT